MIFSSDVKTKSVSGVWPNGERLAMHQQRYEKLFLVSARQRRINEIAAKRLRTLGLKA